MERYRIKKMAKKSFAVFMAMTVILASSLGEKCAKAANDSKKKYVSDIVLSYGKTEADAAKWLKDKGYKVLDGDINAGTDEKSAVSKESNAVLLGYKTTSDPNKAIRDMAVMNMSGGYEVTDMQTILSKQKNNIDDKIDHLIGLASEYRTNYKEAVKSVAKGGNKNITAITTHELLNKYTEDDSKKGMGDILLMDFSNEENKKYLTSILIQSNTELLAIMENILLMSGGNKSKSWLENMSELNADSDYYSRMKKKKKTASLTQKAINKEYGDYLDKVYETFNDFKEKIKEAYKTTDDIYEKYGDDIEKEKSIHDYFNVDEDSVTENPQSLKSDVKVVDAVDNNIEQSQNIRKETEYVETVSIIEYLGEKKYGDGNLLDYFLSDIKEDEKYKLGAILEAMTDVQRQDLGLNVNLYTAIKYAVAGDESIWEKADDNKKDALNESIEGLEKISIYNGVQREMFDGGVALTKSAQKGTSSIFESSNTGEPSAVSAIWVTALSVVGTMLGALIVASGARTIFRIYGSTFNSSFCKTFMSRNPGMFGKLLSNISSKISSVFSRIFYGMRYTKYINHLRRLAQEGVIDGNQLVSQIKKVVWVTQGFVMLLGVAVIAVSIFFSVREILKVIEERKEYYKGDYSKPIPAFMIDACQDEESDTYYNYYKAAKCNRNEEGTTGYKRDNEGLKDFGDINGDTGKQWVALYYSTDESAGNPILADSMEVLYGDNQVDEEYKMLHSFNNPNTGVNLTSETFCYNDKNKGTYLRYKVDKSADNINANASSGGSVFSNASKNISITISALIGLFVGFTLNTILKRRKKSKKS